MKKGETYRDTLRPEYRRSHFPGGLVRDKDPARRAALPGLHLAVPAQPRPYHRSR